MTEQTLDRVARVLATGMPRRAVMKAMLGGAAVTTLGVLGVQQSQARGGECSSHQYCVDQCGHSHSCMRGCLCDQCEIGCPRPRRRD